MNKVKILLRVSSALIFIHLFGHLMGHLSWKTPQDPKMQETVKAMVENKADFMGAFRSLADYYQGYSLILFFVYGLSIWVLWVLSNHTNNESRLVKNLLITFGITYIAFGVIEFCQFFPFAAIVSTLAGVSILGSVCFLQTKKQI